ncbi:3-hydroxyacyl-CoA dehydrogenase/enoyl-CoA hydratase family protein [Acidocella facilis]|jgi:3-hydroxyacyl-CoA dehydrogenase|uniref:3-hydroxyacyl-CoA dehydrogenase/enoyl-CoA hydratase family protein n=1 Tax=Acidocella facilis TaxID=525 RepID=UPI001F19C992|nr:3-hydroxyacyl-CoA dehydrogenase/enoyl-CoA hydratase family protein [Acidocella facilis]
MGAIRKAGVIGAGVMGSGIAAHLANAGLDVMLLDVEAAAATAAVARQLKAGGFMDPVFAERIATGSVDDDLPKVADADWIIEAVAERLDVKQALYARIESVRKPGSVVSSNTSTIPLAALVEGLPEAFAADFLVTHFFNPPRTMPLLELVAGPATRPQVLAVIRDFGDRRLGKSIVVCRDTPGFIANRVGNFWMAAAVNEAIALGLDVEVADAAISKPFGIPKTGIFGLMDLVGIDLMAMVMRSLHGALPDTDALKQYPVEPRLLSRMVEQNRLGQKSGAGFVKLSADRKTREVIDLATWDYRPQREPESDSLDAAKGNPRALIEHEGTAGRYVAAVMEKALAYAAAVTPEIAAGPDAVDTAMRAGYGWAKGPFEIIDQLGAGWLVARLEQHGIPVPDYLGRAAAAGGFYSVEGGALVCLLPDGTRRKVATAPGIITLAAVQLASQPVQNFGAARLWDLGDDVACFEIHTKMNTFNPEVLNALMAALERVEREFRGLVIGTDGPVFSAGADIRQFLEVVESIGPTGFGPHIDHGHRVFKAVKYAPFPVVGAAAGLAFGGGCELLLHCDAIQAHGELSIGLVETSIGLVPGWGGCKEMLLRFAEGHVGAEGYARAKGPVAPALAAFGVIAPAKVSSSAFEARRFGYLRPTDGITMNRARLLADAKAKVLALADGYAPPTPVVVTLSGPSGASALCNVLETNAVAGRITAHDQVVGEALVTVLTGGSSTDPAQPTPEDDITALERAAFITLLGEAATLERVRHMLATGKPLRN